jgi:hypothetical protein
MEPMHDPRFWERVTTSDGHRLWTGALNSDGYGHLRRRGKLEKAHRWAWQLATGETLTRADAICHTCDIRNCVETDGEGVYEIDGAVYPRRGHLFKATQPANVADRDTKGRGRWATGEQHGTHTQPETLRRGAAHPHATMNDEAVRQIRATYTGGHGQLSALARRFKTTPQNIRAIVTGKAWAHVTGNAEPVTDLTFVPRPVGERASRSLLTEAAVREIRARVAAGAVQRHLAAEYGVSPATICNIVKRKGWTHLD